MPGVTGVDTQAQLDIDASISDLPSSLNSEDCCTPNFTSSVISDQPICTWQAPLPDRCLKLADRVCRLSAWSRSLAYTSRHAK